MINFGRKVTEDEVFGYWLRYEYNSRLSERNRIDQELAPFIEKDDYDNRESNLYRYTLLWNSYRGGLLRGIPARDDIEWREATIDETDYKRILLIGSEEWRNLTNNTGEISTCAKRVFDDKENLMRDGRYSYHVEIVLNLVRKIESGENIDPRLILLGKRSGPFTVIDGVHRSLAIFIHYILKKRAPFIPPTVYIGITEKSSFWQIRS